LKGTTAEVTPNEILLAMVTGRVISLTYTDAIYGTCTFNYFAYNSAIDGVVASINFDAGGIVYCAQLSGSISTNTWTFIATPLLTFSNIDTTLTQSGMPADAKIVGDSFNAINETLNAAGTELINALEVKDEVLIITIDGNDRDGYIMDRSFEEVCTHYNKNHTIVTRHNTDIGHLVASAAGYVYFFQGMNDLIRIAIADGGLSADISVHPICPDTTLTQSNRSAEAQATGNAIAQKTQV
jgi:hypothetical protein